MILFAVFFFWLLLKPSVWYSCPVLAELSCLNPKNPPRVQFTNSCVPCHLKAKNRMYFFECCSCSLLLAIVLLCSCLSKFKNVCFYYFHGTLLASTGIIFLFLFLDKPFWSITLSLKDSLYHVHPITWSHVIPVWFLLFKLDYIVVCSYKSELLSTNSKGLLAEELLTSHVHLMQLFEYHLRHFQKAACFQAVCSSAFIFPFDILIGVVLPTFKAMLSVWSRHCRCDGRWVHQLGSRLKYLTAIGWIGMKCCTDVHIHQRMNLNDFKGSWLTPLHCFCLWVKYLAKIATGHLRAAMTEPERNSAASGGHWRLGLRLL